MLFSSIVFRDINLFPVQCIECFKRFENIEKLNSHQRLRRKYCKRFPCETCNERFSSLKQLSDHSNLHDPDNLPQSDSNETDGRQVQMGEDQIVPTQEEVFTVNMNDQRNGETSVAVLPDQDTGLMDIASTSINSNILESLD